MLYSVFAAVVEERNDAIALFYKGNQISFRQLALRVDAMSAKLESYLNFGSNVVTGVFQDDVDSFIVTMLSLSKLGCIAQPVFEGATGQEVKTNVLIGRNLVERFSDWVKVDTLGNGLDVLINEKSPARYGPDNVLYIPRGSYFHNDNKDRSIQHQSYQKYIQWLGTALHLESPSVLGFDSNDPDRVVRNVLPFVLAGHSAVYMTYDHGDQQVDLQAYPFTHICYSPVNEEKFCNALKNTTAALKIRYVLSFYDYDRSAVGEISSVLHAKCEDFKGILDVFGKFKTTLASTARLRIAGSTIEQKIIGSPVYDGAMEIKDSGGYSLPMGIVGDIHVEHAVPGSETTQIKPDRGRYTVDGQIEITLFNPEEIIADGECLNIPHIENLLRDRLHSDDVRIAVDNNAAGQNQLTLFLLSESTVIELVKIKSAVSAWITDSLLQRILFVPVYKNSWSIVKQGKSKGLELIPGRLVRSLQSTLKNFQGTKEFTLFMTTGDRGGILEYERSTDSVKSNRHLGHDVADREVEDSISNILAIAVGDERIFLLDDSATLTEAFLKACSTFGEKGITFIAGGKEEVITYATLLTLAKSNLSALQKRALKPGDILIFQTRNVREFIPLFWACILGGIIPLPMPVASEYKQENSGVDKLLGVLKFLNYPVVLASPDIAASLGALGRVLSLDNLRIIKSDELEASENQVELYSCSENDTSFILLTSGSTGTPKCVPLTHKNSLAHIYSVRQYNNYKTEDVVVNILPIEHITPLLTLHVKSVVMGIHQIHIDTDTFIGNPTVWFETIEKFKGTHTFSPNFAYKLITERCSKQGSERTFDLATMREFKCAGEMISPDVVSRFVDLILKHGGHASQFQPIYGMTELAGAVTFVKNFTLSEHFYGLNRDELSAAEKAQRNNLAKLPFCDVGKPIPGVSVRIVDSHNSLLSEGCVGRVQVKGTVITPGYLHNDEANKLTFTKDGWFNTGDLGFLTNGTLVVTGREKDTIIINGVNYYCHEFEELIKTIKGVNKDYVAVCPKRNSSRGTEELIVFFTPQESAQQEIGLILQEINQRINNKFAVHPSRTIPVKKEAFTKTDSGKMSRLKLLIRYEHGEFTEMLIPVRNNDLSRSTLVQELGVYITGSLNDFQVQALTKIVGDYPQLRKRLTLKRIPELPVYGSGQIAYDELLDNPANAVNIIEHSPELSEIEKLVIDIWSDVLAKSEVGLFDNFFALGGDSIKAIQIVNRLLDHGYHASASNLFLHPTISALCLNLTPVEKNADQEIVTGEIPLTPTQSYLLALENPVFKKYLQILEVTGEKLSGGILQEILQKIMSHHDALRIIFKRSNATVQQNNEPPGSEAMVIDEYDFRDLSEKQATLEVNSVSEKITRALDPAGPLFKAALIHLPASERIMIAAHELIMDYDSWQILSEDIAILIRQHQQREPFVLQPKTASFKHWVELLEDHTKQESFLDQLPYWVMQEQSVGDSVKLRPANGKPGIAEATVRRGFILEKEETDQLLTDAQKAYNTVTSDLLIAALFITLQKIHGNRQVLIELQQSAREDLGINVSRTVGNFTSLHPVVIAIDKTQSLGDQLVEIKEQLRKVPQKTIGYSVLRYKNRREHPWQTSPQIRFYFLQRIHANNVNVREIATHDPGVADIPYPPLQREWNIIAAVYNGQLNVSLDFSVERFDANVVENFLNDYRAMLIDIVWHCMHKEVSQLTPSDLTYKGLSIQQLQSLIDKLEI